jgi:ZIP family zinc transporter
VVEAALWGLLAGSSLLIGAFVALELKPSPRVVGLFMAFGAGVLISAVAYDLVEDAFDLANGSGSMFAGIAAGALTFYLGDRAIAGHAQNRKHSEAEHDAEAFEAIALATVLDGIPESIVIGTSLIGGGSISVAIIVAVFLSNLPEAIGATSGMANSGFPRARLLRMWTGITLITGVAAALGFALFDAASSEALAFVQAFSGGALLTMLSSTMLPEAVRGAGREVGLVTVLGFSLAFLLVQIG